MHYSLNQIEHTCRKAVRGAGLSWGSAEDAGRAIRWLEMMQYSGTGVLAALLQDNSNNLDTQMSVSQDDEALHWQSTEGDLSPLIAGPCVGDYINAAKQPSALLKLEKVIYPLLYIGFMGAAINQVGRTAEVCIDDDIMVIEPNQIYLEKTLLSLNERNATNLQLKLIEPSAIKKIQARKAAINSREVAANDWQVLETFAHRTYVEATEASRIAGAGAGLRDND